jgi:predicted ATPase
MIRLIEAHNYRCLRYISQPLQNLHVLVGPNASGKTTFIDVIAFLGDLISDGLEDAIRKRTNNFQDLLWQQTGNSFELAVELDIPKKEKSTLKNGDYNIIRYEIEIGLEEDNSISIFQEKVILKKTLGASNRTQRSLFPEIYQPPETIIIPKGPKGTKLVISKVHEGNANYYPETKDSYKPSFKLGPETSALKSLPGDKEKYPISIWLKEFITNGIQVLQLNSVLMRNPCPPGKSSIFLPDGSNLPIVIRDLLVKHKDSFDAWIKHLRTALKDLQSIEIIERPEDKHSYLIIQYKNSLKVPSWMVSDGTLRLLALTIPAYLPEMRGALLIEEPENGIHPRAIESVFQSLSSVYNAQILLATHSPSILGLAELSQILCFSKTEEGATDIVSGEEHPGLKGWRGDVNLDDLFAAGILDNG